MKLFTLIFTVISVSVSAQTASDFTITDIDGNSRNLFTELDANNIVVLKFFTNWCSICNNTADEVVAIYNDHQSAGDPVIFWALDRDPNEDNSHATTYRNNHNIPFPVIGEAYPVAQQFGVVYQPEYFIIRPDRSYVKEVSYSAMEAAVQDGLSFISTGVNDYDEEHDLRIVNNTVCWKSARHDQAVLKIYDLNGRTVVDCNLVGGKITELNLADGLYVYFLGVDGEIIASGKTSVFN